MIRIEPMENFVHQTIERGIKLANFANDSVEFEANGVHVIVRPGHSPLGVFLLQQMLQSNYVERLSDFESYSYKTDETKELISEWVKSDPSALSMLLKHALA